MTVGEAEPIGADEAEALVRRVAASLDDLRDAIVRLWSGRGWLTLGYESWADLCDDRFQGRVPDMARVATRAR